MNMTRNQFLIKKRKSLGYAGVTKRYGCPYYILAEWARYRVGLTIAAIVEGRKAIDPSFTDNELQDFIRTSNEGITKIAKEYEKAIAPLGRSVS